jgi:hypothetical protein
MLPTDLALVSLLYLFRKNAVQEFESPWQRTGIQLVYLSYPVFRKTLSVEENCIS